MPQTPNTHLPTSIFTAALLGLAASALLLTTTACDEGSTDCPAIAYGCPEGEESCDDTNEEGCKEYTFGDGECEQIISCAATGDTAAAE
jgi:hypothetical protein